MKKRVLNLIPYIFGLTYLVYCLFNVDDVSGWDVSSCMDFEGMFAATGAEPYKQNLTSWDIQEGARTTSIHYSGPNLYFASDLH